MREIKPLWLGEVPRAQLRSEEVILGLLSGSEGIVLPNRRLWHHFLVPAFSRAGGVSAFEVVSLPFGIFQAWNEGRLLQDLLIKLSRLETNLSAELLVPMKCITKRIIRDG